MAQAAQIPVSSSADLEHPETGEAGTDLEIQDVPWRIIVTPHGVCKPEPVDRGTTACLQTNGVIFA